MPEHELIRVRIARLQSGHERERIHRRVERELASSRQDHLSHGFHRIAAEKHRVHHAVHAHVFFTGRAIALHRHRLELIEHHARSLHARRATERFQR